MRIESRRPTGWGDYLSTGLLLTLVFALAPYANASIICAKDPDLFDNYGKVRNTGDGICAAVANINSFVYLWNTYPGIYGGSNLLQDYDGDHDIDEVDHNTARDRMANGWDYNGQHRDGVYGGTANGSAQDIWQAKLEWLEDFAPGTTIVDGQVQVTGFAGWHKPDPLEDKYPEWSFLWNQVKACEDVELGIVPPDPSDEWHALTLTNLCFDDDSDGIWEPGETRKLHYLDPNGTPDKKIANVDVVDGKLQFSEGTYAGWHIYRAYTESPIPEPCAMVVWGLGIASVVGYRWRRRRILSRE